ncbi:hypothetical protein SAY87_007523 [Trapa incisa]|uniref:Uncharacterized protein n=1 Tax=Trapa incisa TaxID=236973 RepID=A0AAN7KF66_9MYRT|nr:hypothetical protein SAY87_007523 [Trapa incisa]
MTYTSLESFTLISSSNIDNHDEEDLILFSIHYEKYTNIFGYDENQEVTLVRTNQNSIDKKINKNFYGSQLMELDRESMVSTFTLLVRDIVPEIWVEETAWHLTEIADSVRMRLSNLVVQPPLLVDIKIDTSTYIKPNKGSDPNLFHTYDLW